MKILIIAAVMCFAVQALALEKCVIKANNHSQPLGTYPWNAFLCGRRGHTGNQWQRADLAHLKGYIEKGWVFLVGITKMPDGTYAIEARYLPTFTELGQLGWGVEKYPAYFDVPDGEYVEVREAKTEGTFQDWEGLKAWVEVVGFYHK